MIKSKEELELLPDICITENCLSCSVRTPLLQKTSSDNDYEPNILEENNEKEDDCNATLPKYRSKKVSRNND